MDPNIRWHYDHCAYSYDKNTETPEQGRLRSATEAARAEAWLKALPSEAVEIEWEWDGPWDGDSDGECPIPDLVYQLCIKVALPPRTLLREEDMGAGIRRIYRGSDDTDAAHIATFFDADRAADYVRGANAPRVFRASLGMIGMMHATERDDMRVFEAQLALELLHEWEQS